MTPENRPGLNPLKAIQRVVERFKVRGEAPSAPKLMRAGREITLADALGIPAPKPWYDHPRLPGFEDCIGDVANGRPITSREVIEDAGKLWEARNPNDPNTKV
jgi:hypothetical protein